MSMWGLIVRLNDLELALLRQADSDEANERMLAWRADSERTFVMGQYWQALHLAISGMPEDEGVEGPSGFIGCGDYGEELACYSFGYGPAIVYDRDATAAIASAIEALPQDVVATRLASAELHEIYPFAPEGANDADRVWITKALGKLRAFVTETAAKGMNMIRGID
jgi:hypothetical protein